MALIDSLKNVAKSLLNNFGDTVQVKSVIVDNTTFNTVTGVYDKTETLVTVKAVYEETALQGSIEGKFTIHAETPINVFTSIIRNGVEVAVTRVSEIGLQDGLIIYEAFTSPNEQKSV